MHRIFSSIVSALMLLAALFWVSCSCEKEKKSLRIAVDTDWFPLDFSQETSYVNGFIEEFLLEVSGYSGMRFELISTNWDSLLDGMQRGQYDAVLSSLPPYNFNAAKYDFSKNILDIGPVLVVPANSSQETLGAMSNECVGVLAQDQAVLVLQQYPDIIVRHYASVSESLEALANGDVQGVLLDRLIASSYVRNLYAGTLKIATAPLTDAGLRLVVSKGANRHLLHLFDRSIDHLSKKKLQQLLKKWQID